MRQAAQRFGFSFSCNKQRSFKYPSVLQKLYHVAGVEGKPVVFLLTDTQISKESFLEDVNNLLNTGDVPGMFAPEDKERILGSIREWLLSQGAPTTKVNSAAVLAIVPVAA